MGISANLNWELVKDFDNFGYFPFRNTIVIPFINLSAIIHEINECELTSILEVSELFDAQISIETKHGEKFMEMKQWLEFCWNNDLQHCLDVTHLASPYGFFSLMPFPPEHVKVREDGDRHADLRKWDLEW